MTDKPQVVDASELAETALIAGDLSKLTPEARLSYYRRVCETLGLNPWTRPFDYITFQGRLQLYARRDCTDQLRGIHKVSLAIVARERVDDVYLVTAKATLPDGRADESTGAVSLKGLTGNDLANAIMKAETKAKRRVTLSIVGLGWLDETETETVPGARAANVDMDTGEIEEPTDDLARQETAPNNPSPSPDPVGDKPPIRSGASPKPWTTDPTILARFWSWIANTVAISEAQALEALGVHDISEYAGTMKDAKQAIEAWVEAESAEAEAEIEV